MVHNIFDFCKQLGDEPSLYTINNTVIEFTPEHPFLTKEGWKSLVQIPESPYDIQKPMFLKLGDYINVNGLWEEVKEIKVVRSDLQMNECIIYQLKIYILISQMELLFITKTKNK